MVLLARYVQIMVHFVKAARLKMKKILIFTIVQFLFVLLIKMSNHVLVVLNILALLSKASQRRIVQ